MTVHASCRAYVWAFVAALLVASVLACGRPRLYASEPAASPAVTAPASYGAPELTVLHINDIHGFIFAKPGENGTRRGGMAILKTALDQERREALGRGSRSIFLFAGDMFQGTPVVDMTQGRCMIDFLSQLRLTAMCLGNHDFDYGCDALVDRLSTARFPVVDTNVHTTRSLARFLHETLLIPEGAFRVGLVGATTEQTKTLSFPRNVDKVDFDNVAGALAPAVAHLRAQGANVVIAITHDGVDDDRALARKVPGLDLIVGGHTHTVLATEIHEGSTVIVQTGDNARFLGEVRFALVGDQARFVSYRLIPVTAPPFAPDPGIEREVDTYMQPVQARMAAVVGQLDVSLSVGLRGDDSPVASLLAQSVREATGVQIAAVNVGGVRRGLPRGPVTWGQVFELAPFGNRIVSGTMTGAQIRKAIERSAAGEWLPYTSGDAADLAKRLLGRTLRKGLRPGRRLSGFLQCAGLTYRFDPSLPQWARVTQVEVDGSPLVDTATYTVACSDFLKVGGDGMEEFKLLAGVKQTGKTDREILEAYFSHHRPVREMPPVTVVNQGNEVQVADSAVAAGGGAAESKK